MRDDHYMRRALELAARGLGETAPNPVVGCVIVRGGRVVGEGFHRRAGGPHAEVAALAQAAERARGGTAFVTLEPCSHHGRTPPCAPRLIEAGVRRVVVATRDTDPRVSGRGLALLRRAGIRVVVGAESAAARWINRRFLSAHRLGRPFVLLKAALTLDGRIATAAGESKWVTGPAQRRAARRLRRLHDAVLIGIETALADDPSLLPSPGVGRPFVRVVLDSRLRLSPRCRMLERGDRHPVWVVTTSGRSAARRRLESAGARVIELPGRGRPEPGEVLAALWDAGLRSVMVEGGGEVLGSFLRAGLLDELALFRAPILLGGRGSRPAFGGADPARLADGLVLRRRLPPDGVAPEVPSELAELWYPR